MIANMQNRKIFWWSGFVFAALFYIAVRWRCLADSCLWFDEIFGVHAASHGWFEMIRFVALDLIHPPLFYVLLKVWISAGGESVFWLRLFPFLFSIAAIAPFFLLCRELNLKNGEILTAFLLVAVNGALIRYSQEVRMYSMLFCFALVSLWLFARVFNRQSKTILIWLFVANLLLIYTHYFGWLVVLSELTAIFVLHRKQIKAFLISTSLLMLMFAPWIWAIASAANQNAGFGQNLGWAAKPGVKKIVQFLLTLVEPFYYQLSNADATNIWIIVLPLILIILVAAGFNFAPRKTDFNSPLTNYHLPLIFAFVPFAAAFAASWILPFSVWGARHLIIISAPAVLLISILIWRLPIRETRFAALVLYGILIFAGGALHFNRIQTTFIWCGWREIVAEADKIETNSPTTIYVFEDEGAYQLWFALRGNPKFRLVSIDGYADIPEDKAYFLPRGFDEVKAADKSEIAGEKFWLAFRDKAWFSDKAVLKDLRARNYEIGERLVFNAQGVSIFLVPIEKISDNNSDKPPAR